MKSSNQYSSLLLDSGGGWSSDESKTYVAFKKPELSFSSIGKKVRIKSVKGSKTVDSDPLEILDGYLRQGFIAVGYIGYEYSQYTNEGFTPLKKKDGYKFPDVNFLLYKEEEVDSGDCDKLYKNFQPSEITANIAGSDSKMPPLHICPNMSISQYVDMINNAKSYIEHGDIYQVNLSQRFNTQFLMDPLDYFLKFSRVQPVPYGSFMDFGDFQLISGSMELFLSKKGNKIVTNPIKGTIKRGITEEKDAIMKAKLVGDSKERAENLMIVDLMRNDLARVSKIGSIKVNKLFEVETYSTLHQMVSEVQGQVKPDIPASEIIRNIFPPGSVTGAPKKRTLEIIDELEPHLRGPYCGAIGVFYPEGDFTLSVGIRIMLTQGNKAIYFVGGGIVWDSDPEKEYQETLLKSKAVIKAMGACQVEL